MCFFFFFKQKTAYEIRLSLVGSEMCIRRQGSSDAIPHAVALAHTLAHADPEHHLHAVLRQPV